MAYDHAVLRYRDIKTVTNFPVAYYSHQVTGELLPLDEVLQVGLEPVMSHLGYCRCMISGHPRVVT